MSSLIIWPGKKDNQIVENETILKIEGDPHTIDFTNVVHTAF